MMEDIIFCGEEMNDYQKTIVALALSYLKSAIYKLTEKNIEDLAFFLKIDKQLLEKALLTPEDTISYNTEIEIGHILINGSELMDSSFFAAIIRLYFARNSLEEIRNEASIDAVKHNIELFDLIMHLFDLVNATIATAECMSHNHFSLDYTLFSSTEFNPKQLINMLQLSLHFSSNDSSLALLITEILRYEFSVRFNALQLIVIVQIIKHSVFFENEIRDLASELYDQLLSLLKNGRVISVQTNLLHINKSDKSQDRGRADNTIPFFFPAYASVQMLA